MKRVTFVFIGILIILVSTVLSQKHFEDKPDTIVKTDLKKHQIKGIYD